ncbi:MAG: YeeE/YedE family protein [Deltaproteobacteria bacterium]|nr:YeeE/YedE family protein [Deltaproteobacteria bacterium]
MTTITDHVSELRVVAPSDATEPAPDRAPAVDAASAPADLVCPTAHRADWNPYVAGVALGLVLLATYLLMGFGLGSSAAATRIAVAGLHAVAPGLVEGNAYLGTYVAGGANPLDDWMVFEVLGVLLGGVLAAYSARRIRRFHLIKGPTASRGRRILYAIVGGVLMGFAARLARGCTSGQALTGGAVMALGSWIFMMAVFVGGYLTAPFARRQWR